MAKKIHPTSPSSKAPSPQNVPEQPALSPEFALFERPAVIASPKQSKKIEKVTLTPEERKEKRRKRHAELKEFNRKMLEMGALLAKALNKMQERERNKKRS